ncbi:MAG: DUF1573 domain-containing protein [Muribaculaceae bacterium]|nr:DUF1573 domain-containing protein [Muribaculaceae bacterium]
MDTALPHFVKTTLPIFISIFILCFTESCGDSKRKAYEKAVIEWTGKEILFPDSMRLVDGGMIAKPDADFTIVSYYDSVGCSECKLRLTLWNHFMDKVDSYAPEEVCLIIISSPEKKKDLPGIIRQYGFRHTFIIDEGNHFADMNRLPDQPFFRTFLLDSEGKVIIIGNPLDTPALGKMYFKKLGIDEMVLEEVTPTATFDFGKITPGDTVRHRFSLYNNSPDTLRIKDIETSCECTTAKISSYMIPPDTEYCLDISFTDTVSGSFIRSISLSFENNLPESRFEISGEINQL